MFFDKRTLFRVADHKHPDNPTETTEHHGVRLHSFIQCSVASSMIMIKHAFWTLSNSHRGSFMPVEGPAEALMCHAMVEHTLCCNGVCVRLLALAWGAGRLVIQWRKSLSHCWGQMTEIVMWERTITVQSTVNSHWESMTDLQLQVNRKLKKKEKWGTYWYKRWDHWIFPLETEGSPNLESRVSKLPQQSSYRGYSLHLSGDHYLKDIMC